MSEEKHKGNWREKIDKMELQSTAKQRKIKTTMITISETLKRPAIKGLTLSQWRLKVSQVKGLEMPSQRVNTDVIHHWSFTVLAYTISMSLAPNGTFTFM